MKSKHYIPLALMLLVAVISCKSNKTGEQSPSDKAQENIRAWLASKPIDYPGYNPVAFGELTSRYQQSNRTFQLNNLIEAEKSKPQPNPTSIDSLENLLKMNKGEFLGYTILHKYTTQSVAGETVENENLFFLDSLFRIITILNADAYDQIMDEKLIFRQESVDTLGR